jgi:hypothetical protein
MPDSKLKQQNYREWLKAQSTEELEKELVELDKKLVLLKDRDPKAEAEAESRDAQSVTEEQSLAEIRWLQGIPPDEREKMMKEWEGPLLTREQEQEIAERLSEEEFAWQETESPSYEPPWITEQLALNRQIRAVEQQIKAAKWELDLRDNQGLSNDFAAPTSAGKRKHSNHTLEVTLRCAVVKRHANERVQQICHALDVAKDPLPRGQDWDKFRRAEGPWTSAYMSGGKILQGRIRSIITKCKGA